ncbi:MAG: carboxypeptidase-like regulatory domain-containing protein, partial [Candidatus Sulfotelmatobacter sp.]
MQQRLAVASPWRLSTYLSVLFLLVAAGWAQELGTGVLSGEVSDPQGAVVRGAQITTVQKTTGLQRITATNNSGLFVVNNLVPGDYELHIAAAGFADYSAVVHLEVGQQTNLRIRLSLQKQ